MKYLIEFIVAFLALGLTYVLTSEGLWGAALMFFNVLFAAMIAFNFYEPLARLVDSTGINWGFSDTLCMLGLFCISLVVLRLTTETIAPVDGEVPDARVSRGPACLRPRGRSGHHGDRPARFPRGAGAQEDLLRDRPQEQTSVWVGARPSLAELLSIRDGRGFFESGSRRARSVSHLRARRAGERLRSQGRVAAAALRCPAVWNGVGPGRR